MHKTCLLALFSVLILYYTSNASEAAYPIGPGDVLEVSVWGHENLKREVLVPPDGVIAFPLVQEIDIRGMTVSKVRELITQKLAPFVPDATVTVILLASKSLSAYVIGKVNKAGQFPTNLDTTIMQALSMAGGFTPFASPDRIFILRQENGATKKITFDYNQIVNGKNLEQDVILQRGDVIVVP
jgi:polysaccharide export outer membrane protein